jgi:starch synthase (maltosyl-transferring)
MSLDLKHFNGKSRTVVCHVSPEIEGGKYPIKRVKDEWVQVEADAFADGHDLVSVRLLFRQEKAKEWNSVAMVAIGNDHWKGAFQCTEEGNWFYTVQAFIDHPQSWLHNFRKRLSENNPQEWKVQLQIGVQLLNQIQLKYPKEKAVIQKWIKVLEDNNLELACQTACSEKLELYFQEFPFIENPSTYEKELGIKVQRKKAGYSTWYSFFPRSANKKGIHGTFKDCEALLPRIEKLGFDVVYFPPIHPIGLTFRKGKNNSLNVGPEEPGCPYAIGSEQGGHTDILPELGNLADFKSFIQKANKRGIETAMDFAIQCSPDHPWAKEHRLWFKERPDGTIQYAENPPKKYQDIYPIDFESTDWKNMWEAWKEVVLYWVEAGVKIFRVDNPHTKSFYFWQWLISEIHQTNPEVIFLSEAFTRPRIMEDLAKKGFDQSYTYFSWRNSKWELEEYMQELTQTDRKEYFRPNFWPNTHDINPYILQTQNENQFIIRFVLAATLSSNYGLFSPVYESLYSNAIPGKEEYLNSEKYEVGQWSWNWENRLTEAITKVNKIRKDNLALQFTNNYKKLNIDNGQLLAFSKVYGENRILVIVNLDAQNKQSAMLNTYPDDIGLYGYNQFKVNDLITGEQYQWHTGSNYVELNPHKWPFHIFSVQA